MDILDQYTKQLAGGENSPISEMHTGLVNFENEIEDFQKNSVSADYLKNI